MNEVMPQRRQGMQPGEILAAQRSTCDKLGIHRRQCLEDKRDHGTWMDSVIEQADADDLVVFFDVDGFPLSREAFQCEARSRYCPTGP